MSRLNSVRTILSLAILLTLSACQAALAPTLRAPDQPTPSARAAALKILSAEEGITTVSIAQLKASGLVQGAPYPATLRLSFRGRPWPYWLDGQGAAQRLLFFAQAADSLYSKENVARFIKPLK